MIAIHCEGSLHLWMIRYDSLFRSKKNVWNHEFVRDSDIGELTADV